MSFGGGSRPHHHLRGGLCTGKLVLLHHASGFVIYSGVGEDPELEGAPGRIPTLQEVPRSHQDEREVAVAVDGEERGDPAGEQDPGRHLVPPQVTPPGGDGVGGESPWQRGDPPRDGGRRSKLDLLLVLRPCPGSQTFSQILDLLPVLRPSPSTWVFSQFLDHFPLAGPSPSGGTFFQCLDLLPVVGASPSS